MSAKTDFLPIILGSDENAYGCVRLIEEKYPDVRPLILCTRLLVPTMHSRLFDYETYENFDREEVFVPVLQKVLESRAGCYGKLLVIPCSDYYSALVSKNIASFGGLISNPIPDASLLSKFETKDKFYALCEEFGVDYPETVVVAPDERAKAAGRLPFPFPIVVKPENSNAYEYLHLKFPEKKKVYFISSEDEYERMASALDRNQYSGKLVIQRFIPGGDDSMRVVNSYSDSSGSVAVSCSGHVLLEEYAPYTLGNYAAIITEKGPGICEVVKRFLDRIGYRGFSNIDMKYDAATGKCFLFEINPRLGRSSYFVRASGINIMSEMIEDVVYANRREQTLYSNKEAMWSNVPVSVLKKYAGSSVRDLIDRNSKDCIFTLLCKNDLSLKRLYRITRFYNSHRKNYKLYYFDKNSRQFTFS